MLSATVLTASGGPPRPSGRFLGAVLSRLGRAQGVPGGRSEAPKLLSDVFFPLHILLQLRAPFSTHFGALLGRFWSL